MPAPSGQPALDRTRVEGAIFGAVVGDALGWPIEDRARRVGGTSRVRPRLAFSDWTRREGGSFAPHEEAILPGSYSDDTQLILAVARSLGQDEDWYEHLTRFELPFWLLYERGGGGATKRAAQAWARERPPWLEPPRDRPGYFAAGGNGVAMRVLPHCLHHAGDPDFTELSAAILLDGTATHGHPRALVGARAYGFAAWEALRRQHPVGYGELLDATLGGRAQWGAPPDTMRSPSEWFAAAEEAEGGEYGKQWEQAVEEMLGLLDAARTGLGQGALAVDRPVLKELGALDKRVNGAGTVSAAAALFLASRYASQPGQGLTAAAYAKGADTDTLASMTGGLLGAIHGLDWLRGLAREVQDSDYIFQVAEQLASGRAQRGDAAVWRQAMRPELYRALDEAAVGKDLELPVFGRARCDRLEEFPTRARSLIRQWVLATELGQTLAIKRITSLPEHAGKADAPKQRDREQGTPEGAPLGSPASNGSFAIGVVLQVQDLAAVREFYEQLLELKISKESASYVSFAGVLALEASGESQTHFVDTPALERARSFVALFLDSDRLSDCRKRLVAAKVPATEIAERAGRRSFRCADPEGNVIEVRERRISA